MPECLRDCKGSSGNILREHEAEASRVRAHLRDLQTHAKNEGWAMGEVVFVLAKYFQYDWETLPIGVMPEISAWLTRNRHKRLRVFNPTLHDLCMEHVQEYRDNFSQKELMAQGGGF